MKATVLLFILFIGIVQFAGQGEEPEGNPIVGTGCWRHIRHDLVRPLLRRFGKVEAVSYYTNPQKDLDSRITIVG